MCSIGARASANGLEIAIHDVSIDIAERWMKKSFGKPADDFKIEALPQFDGAFVGADYEVVLHGAKGAFACAIQRMSAHCARHAAAHRRHRSHVAAIGDVRSAATLIRLQAVGAND